MLLALLLAAAPAPQDSPAKALLEEAKSLEAVAESPGMQLRALPERLAAIDAAVAKYREARSAPGATASLVEKALGAEEDLHWRAGQGLALVGSFDKARERYEASVETCRGMTTERHSRIARTRAAIAGMELDRGRLEEAELEAEEAEGELSAGSGERRVERRVHVVRAARARVDFTAGRHDAAVLSMERATREAREVGMLGAAGHHAEDLAGFLLYLGRPERAVAVLREAVTLADKLDRRAFLAAMLARAEEGAGRPDEALAILDAEVETFLPKTRAHHWLAVRAAHFRVRSLRALGRLEEARRVLEEQGPRFEVEEEALLFGLGLRAVVALESGRAQESIEFGEACLEGNRARGKQPSATVLRTLGLAKVAVGAREEGLDLLRRALASDLRWVSRLQGTEDLASNLDVVVRSAEDLLDALVGNEGSADPPVLEEAFRAIEASKAEGLRRALVRGIAGEPPLDLDLEERRRDLYRRLSLLSARMVDSGREGASPGLAQRREDLERQAEDLEREFRARHPRAGSVRGLEPVGLGELQAFLAPGTAVLDYLFGEREVFALVAWKEGAKVVRVGSARALREASAATWALLRRGDIDSGTIHEATRGLSNHLVGSALAGMEARIRRLVVLPDGPLHRLPFEALPSPAGTGFLVEDFGVSYAPSASALVALARGALDPEGFAFLGVAVAEGTEGAPGSAPAGIRGGFGPLPRAEEEVRRAAAIAGGEPTLLLGRAATPDAFRALDLRRFRLLHFAAHGIPDEEAPGRSGLLLHDAADPEKRAVLEAREVSTLSLRSDLVVLSACRSGGGPIQPGEGVRSLARSFLEAGSRSVLLTLWEVSDPVCLAFMDLFYGALRDGATKAEALRQAKVECLRAGGSDAALRSPAAWAAFTLMGDAEGRLPLVGARPRRASALVWVALAGILAGGGTFLLTRRNRRVAAPRR